MFSWSPRKFHSLLVAPALLPLLMLVAPPTADNHPPTAVNDSYSVHGTLVVPGPGILANDTDPDGDLLHIGSCGSVAHGTLNCTTQSFTYEPNYGYAGADSFTYQSCDGYGACDTGTVNLSVENSPPVAVDDNYTFHGDTFLVQGPNALRENDSDPEGDPFSVSAYTQTSHGTVTYLFQYGALRYELSDPSYVGTDSFTYHICDNLGLCASATVTFNIVNSPPVARDDEYTVNAGDALHVFGPNALRENDSDPDNDPISVVSNTQTTNGTVNYSHTDGGLSYQPNDGFVGADSFTYRLCDNLGLCATATVTIEVNAPPSPTPTPTPTLAPTPTPEDDRDNGACNCNECVGEPVNVTTGNVYLEQSDYQLSGVGPAINVTRSYNSLSQVVGILGRGWSTMYDESIQIYNATFIRFNAPDGRATYFSRPNATAIFSSIEQDFHGQITQNGNGTFTLTMTDGSSSQFNFSGKLLSLVGRNGNQSLLAYDANGHLASITDTPGHVLTVTSNSSGQALSISDTMGTIAGYTYGGGNELLSVTYPDNSGFHFSYDGGYRLTTVTDALGNIVESHTYNSSGQATTSERQGGVEHYSLSYFDGETEATDALGRVTRYTFDRSKGRNVVTRVEGLCNCGGGGSQVQVWTHDDQLNVTSKTDALGQVTSYTYDGSGNRLTETDATGTVTLTYNQFGEVLTRTDQMSGVTVNTYDARGDLTSTTDARGKTTNFAYDPRGLLLSVTDARGKVTAFAYDASGNLITKTDALSHTTQFVYDARSRLTRATNALGNVTTFAYDPVGRLTQVTQADGTTISYEYDPGGRRTAIVDAKGNRSSYAYDGANRLTSETDALNQSTSYTYDSMSNLTATTDALSRVTNYDYDDLNRLVKTTHPPATTGAIRLFETIEYDAAGNVTKRIDTAGRATQYGYDAVNRLTTVTDPAAQVTRYEYNPRSEITALVDALAQRYRFNYNSVGQITHVRRGTTVMSFTYDAVGNRKERTAYNGAMTDYSYDALNRLKEISYPDTTTVSYTYDKLSRLQTATNENGTIDFDYNKMNRLTNITDGFGQVVEYNYDANGNRTKLSLNAATMATYRYDAVNRLTRILDAAGAAFTFDYDATNKLTQKKAPNNVKTSYQYDDLDRLTRLTDTKGVTNVKDRQYQYNAASQITQIAEPSITRSYGYDAVDRLTSANYTSPTQPRENYVYDSVGNRTSSQLSTSYGYQPFNRLTNTATASYSYDTNGNLISKTDSNGTTQYVWDFESRLKQVTLPSGRTVAYKYDALGRRIQRTPSTGSGTNFIYDGQDVVKDINSDGSTVEYLNGPGIDNKLRFTDSRMAATGPLYFLQDQLGSTTALVNSQGVAVSQINYDSFGNPSTGANLTRYTYTGREFDSDTGLFYYRARWYDPKVGRFIGEDPIGLAGGINQFAYVGNDPQNGKDPSGLYNEDVHYYLTYFIATKFSCVTKDEARLIADADQSTDEISDTQPFLGWTVAQAMRNSDNHAFTEYVNSRLNDLRSAALSTTHNYVGVGRYLHFLQDTFSHRGFSNSVIGQFGFNGVDLPFFGGFVVDHTNHDIEKSEEMARTTFYALLEWAKRKDCKCQFSDIGSWWPKVMEFLNASNGDLETKRQILNVPRR